MATAEEHAPLGYALALVARAHRTEMQRMLDKLGLHVGQERFVFELSETPGITQSELAERLQVEQPTVAKALARMGRQGLVERRRDERDARATRLYLTAQGAALYDDVVRCWRALDERMAAGMSPAVRARLRALLLCVRDNFSTLPEGEGERPQ